MFVSLKGKDIKAFHKFFQTIETVSDIRIEVDAKEMRGEVFHPSKTALAVGALNLEGLVVNEPDLTFGMDLTKFDPIKFATDDDEVVFKAGSSQAGLVVGKHIRRNFRLLAEAPEKMRNAYDRFDTAFKLPKDMVKPLIESLDMKEKHSLIKIRLADDALFFLTEDRIGNDSGQFVIPKADIVGLEGADKVEGWYDFEQFSAIREVPVDENLTLKLKTHSPLIISTVAGRFSGRLLLAPSIPTEYKGDGEQAEAEPVVP